MKNSIHRVILCGGMGKRLWPLSTSERPKAFLALNEKTSLLQKTIERLERLKSPQDSLPKASVPLRAKQSRQNRKAGQTIKLGQSLNPVFLQKQQIKSEIPKKERVKTEGRKRKNAFSFSESLLLVGQRAHKALFKPFVQRYSLDCLLEPESRNTAYACILAALHIAEKNPEDILIVFPSDHEVEEGDAFFQTLFSSLKEAQKEKIILLGVSPLSTERKEVETDYGYIEVDLPTRKAGRKFQDMPSLHTDLDIFQQACLQEEFSMAENRNITSRQYKMESDIDFERGEPEEPCFPVKRFIEKPGLKQAEIFLNMPNIFWNSGIFIFKARVFLEEAEQYCPEEIKAVKRALQHARKVGNSRILRSEDYKTLPSISIDKALMEKTKKLCVFPLKTEWSDLGSWYQLWQKGKKNAAGNKLEGFVREEGCRNVYLRADQGSLSAYNLTNITAIREGEHIILLPLAPTKAAKPLPHSVQRQGFSSKLTHAVPICKDWLFHQALPFWAQTGIDHLYGGFFEQCDWQGRADEKYPYKRFLVQARQTYVYAKAGSLGWGVEQGQSVSTVRKGFEFMTQACWSETGGFVNTVLRDGTPYHTETTLYNQAFALLAFAQIKLTQKQSAKIRSGKKELPKTTWDTEQKLSRDPLVKRDRKKMETHTNSQRDYKIKPLGKEKTVLEAEIDEELLENWIQRTLEHALFLFENQHKSPFEQTQNPIPSRGNPEINMDSVQGSGFLSDTTEEFISSSSSISLETELPTIRSDASLHFLEALLLLYDASGENRYLGYAEKIITLFFEVFADMRSNQIQEYFYPGWRGDPKSPFCPGHYFEWAWLLLLYQQRTSLSYLDEAQSLYAFARTFGQQESRSPWIRDIFERRTSPIQAFQADQSFKTPNYEGLLSTETSRLWPQAESLKVGLSFYKLGFKTLEPSLLKEINALFLYYINPAPGGGWMDSGNVNLAKSKEPISASTFYHIISTFAEILSLQS